MGQDSVNGMLANPAQAVLPGNGSLHRLGTIKVRCGQGKCTARHRRPHQTAKSRWCGRKDAWQSF
jgi:hypothetical protein